MATSQKDFAHILLLVLMVAGIAIGIQPRVEIVLKSIRSNLGGLTLSFFKSTNVTRI